jgi:hypothetical protein
MKCWTLNRTRIWMYPRKRAWAMKGEVVTDALCNTGAD